MRRDDAFLFDILEAARIVWDTAHKDLPKLIQSLEEISETGEPWRT